MSFERGPVQTLAGGMFVLAAAAVLAAVIAGGAFSVSAGPELRFTGASSAVLFAIAALGLIVVAFTTRYCIDDPGRARLLWLMVAAALSAGIVATAADLLTLVAAWVTTTAILAALLAHRSDLGIVRVGRRRSLGALAATDAMLLAATAIILSVAGNVRLDELGSVADSLAGASVLGFDSATLVALLIVGAAVGRCAQIPFGGWLPATLTAPTPVSALLHAGVVNGGALLLIGLAPLVFGEGSAVWLLFTIGSATMLWGTGQMVARPDVKGGLMLSTRGQMGFMLLQCAVGAFAAALFHLIAHGMYKAYLFLGSGGAIAEQRELAGSPRNPIPPARGWRAAREAAVSLVTPALAISIAVAALAPALAETTSGLVLLLFAYATGAQATWWWLRFREPHGRTVYAGLLALLAGSGAYVALLWQAKELFSIDPVSSPVPAVALLPVLALAASATGLKWLAAAGVKIGGSGGRGRRLRRRAYAIALSLGTWSPRRPSFEPAIEISRIEPDHAPLEAR